MSQSPLPSKPPQRSQARAVLIVARKELKETFRDGRFRILAACVLALLLAGLAAGRMETREARQAIETARAADHEVWVGQGPRNPHSAAHFGHYAFKPRPVLSALDRGVDAYLGSAVWLEAHWQDPFALRPAEDRTALQRFGELTAAFTLQVLAPLLVIFLGFAAFAGERERGTLLQLSGLGLRPRTLAFGKALGLGSALALVLVPACLLGSIALAATGAGDWKIGSIAVLAGAYGAYFALLLALVLAVSAWAKSARGALVTVLGFWMMSTLIVPRLVADVAERIHPIPTPRAFFAAIAEDNAQGMNDMGNFQERRQKLQEQVLEEHGVDSVDELPISFAGLSLQASEEHSNLVFDKHYGDLWQRYGDQERLHLWGSALSPTLAVRSISMAVSGTDIARHRHFADAAEAHRREMVKFLNDDLTYNAKGADFGYMADEELWQETPTFAYRSPSLGEVLSGQIPAFLWLTIWLLGAGTLAVSAAARMPVIAGQRSTVGEKA